MATFKDSRRNRVALRAAMILLVAVDASLCGCQSPWRGLKNNEPSLEELLVTSEPWDAEARLRESTDRSNLADRTNNRSARANPYALKSAAGDAATPQRAAGESDEFTEADFEAAYASAPPHLRPLLKRQWAATQAASAAKQSNSKAPDRVTSDSKSPDSKSSDTAPEDLQQASAAAQERSEGPVSYRLSDTEDFDASPARSASDRRATDGLKSERTGAEEASTENSVRDRHAADDRSGLSSVKKKNLPVGQASRSERGADYASDEEETRQDDSARLEELKPPSQRKTSRQIAHAEPVDTGMHDEVRQLAHSSKQRDPQTTVGSVAESSSEVITASAEVELTTPSKEMSWRDHARAALKLLEEERDSNAHSPVLQLNSQAASRLLHLSLGELEPALKPIEGLQSHEQDFFRHEFQALHDAIDPAGNPVLARRWTLVMDSQRRAMSHLGAVSNLEIKNAAFCSNVDGFGVVSKFPTATFQSNQEFLLYCELENFVSQPVKDGFETVLQGSYEIVDASGRRVADVLLPEDLDVCRHQRRDYFIAYRVYMPPNLEPGRYQLRLTIEDMKGRKFGQSSLDFQIGK